MSWIEFERIARDIPEFAPLLSGIQSILEKGGACPRLTSFFVASQLKVSREAARDFLDSLVEKDVLTVSDTYECPRCRTTLAPSELSGACGNCNAMLEELSPISERCYALANESLLPKSALVAEEIAATAIFGILTALPHEAVAVQRMLDGAARLVRGERLSVVYDIGTMPSLQGPPHGVVHVSLHGDMGTNPAAVATQRLLTEFPNIKRILIVGIAGGCPNPQKIAEHVRLGDVVISDRCGVVQYDNVKIEIAGEQFRPPPRAPSKPLLDAAGLLFQDLLNGIDVASPGFGRGAGLSGFERPPAEEDVLQDGESVAVHPQDSDRVPGIPRIFRGAIGSANAVLKDPSLRDTIRDRFSVRAIEMESSGAAQAVWESNAEYLVVRSICDYCNGQKTDRWQRYAALAAAVVARALLARTP